MQAGEGVGNGRGRGQFTQVHTGSFAQRAKYKERRNASAVLLRGNVSVERRSFAF